MPRNDPEDSPRYLALVQLLRTSDTVWEASRVFFRRWNLSPSQFNVLNLLRLTPAGMSQTELGRQLLTHRSNVTGLVDRLEERGLVARHDVSDDRRAHQVVLTPAGRKLLGQVLPGYYRGAERLWTGQSDRRLKQLMADLAAAATQVLHVAAELEAGDRREE